MTSPELHELVDIVMYAREGGWINCSIFPTSVQVWNADIDYCDYDYPTFSDFTQAVKEYIKSLETK